MSTRSWRTEIESASHCDTLGPTDLIDNPNWLHQHNITAADVYAEYPELDNCLVGDTDLEELRQWNAEQNVKYMDRLHQNAEILGTAMRKAAMEQAMTQSGDINDRIEENLQNADTLAMRLLIVQHLLGRLV